MNESNCLVLRSFSFGGSQYKKGSNAFLDGKARDFAENHGCANFFKEREAKKTKSKK
jgi:hypothetical protein